jgi:hypothetical protein
LRIWVQSKATRSGVCRQDRQRKSHRSGPCIASLTWTPSLDVNRQTRLIECLALPLASSASNRPNSDRLTRLTCRATPTISASVLIWLFRNPTHTLVIHSTASNAFMAAPSAGRVAIVSLGHVTIYQLTPYEGPPIFMRCL